MSNEIFYFNEQHRITFIQQSKKNNVNRISNRCSINLQYCMQMLKSHFNFIIRQFRQRIDNKLMFLLYHNICHRMIKRNNFNFDSIFLSNYLIIFLFSKFSFSIAMLKHSCQLITFYHMNLTIVSVLKLKNARIFIHSIKLFWIIIIVFIASDEDMCTQFMSIFLKNVDT